MKIMKEIGIIGSGVVVGSATGKGFHRLGHDVLFYDIAKQRLLNLKEHGYQTTTSIQDIIDKTDISFTLFPARHKVKCNWFLIFFFYPQ
jgi:3-hydroxyisobutyrate dehydrogenase-like beta-hydroxyacid dehydrogenase